jgi:hypothetical protein
MVVVSNTWGRALQAVRSVTRLSLGRFRLWSAEAEREMSLFQEGPKDQSIQTGLASVLAVLVLVATVIFYRFFRYFPA